MNIRTSDAITIIDTEKELGFIMEGRMFGPYPPTAEFLYVFADLVKNPKDVESIKKFNKMVTDFRNKRSFEISARDKK